MEQEKKYRHELKYRIPMSEYLAMRSRLKAVMDADPHAGEDGPGGMPDMGDFDPSDMPSDMGDFDPSDMGDFGGGFSMGGGGANLNYTDDDLDRYLHAIIKGPPGKAALINYSSN